MKLLASLLTATLAFATVTTAHAQQAATTPQQTIALSPVEGAIHSPFKMAYDQAREYQGQYMLANGKTLSVSRWGQRLFADVAGAKDVELVAIAPATFVTPDGTARVTFQQAANGEVLGLQLTTRATQLALATVTQGVLAAR